MCMSHGKIYCKHAIHNIGFPTSLKLYICHLINESYVEYITFCWDRYSHFPSTKNASPLSGVDADIRVAINTGDTYTCAQSTCSAKSEKYIACRWVLEPVIFEASVIFCLVEKVIRRERNMRGRICRCILPSSYCAIETSYPENRSHILKSVLSGDRTPGVRGRWCGEHGHK